MTHAPEPAQRRRLITVWDAARRLGISGHQVMLLIQQGRLDGFQVGGSHQRYVDSEQVETVRGHLRLPAEPPATGDGGDDVVETKDPSTARAAGAAQALVVSSQESRRLADALDKAREELAGAERRLLEGEARTQSEREAAQAGRGGAEAELREPQPIPASRRTLRRWVPALALAIALLAASWVAGYLLTEENAPRGDVTPGEARAAQPQGQPKAEAQNRVSRKREVTPNKSRERTRERPVRLHTEGSGTEGSGAERSGAERSRTEGPGSGAVVANLVSNDAPTSTAPDTPERREVSRKASEKKKPASPPLPPAPTRYLYHLVNQKTGDHFVTTDGNTASEYEAKGYGGGAIGRIYTYQEDGTRAITTDAGTAYIFISPAPKTEPPSDTVALWYSTNNNGDFFYTTSESESKQDGWTGSLMGYVRSL